ncbi:MAG TPA: FAD-dependent oxidoreductase, partial [Thermodesulfobacteriota bacterium]|nr:FAD-dependent oxidoreductase [Thermodesulfobacteriota bacterium]
AGQGHEVTVIERDRQVGGLCKTVRRDGYCFDLGGHRFISANPALVALVESLLGPDLLIGERRSVIRLEGKDYRYPIEAGDVLRQAGLRASVRYVASFARQRLFARPRDEEEASFEGWVVRRFGRALYTTFFGQYTEKLWGLSPRELSADWAPQRISLVNLWDVARRAVGLGQGTPRTYARRYYYPRRGFGQIAERLAEAAVRLGARIELGTRVAGLAADGRRLAAATVERDDGGRAELTFDVLVSTIPLPDLGRLLPQPDPAVREAASQLAFRSLRFLNLMLDRPDVSPNTWIYVPEKRYLMTRIQEPRRRTPEAAPPGKTSLMLEIPCRAGDEIWQAPDDRLAARVLDDLKALGLDVAGDVRGYFSTFAEHAYPVYTLDYQRHRRTLIAAVGRYENAATCGRQGLFRYCFSDAAMEMGFAAARWAAGRGRRREIEGRAADKRLIETTSIVAGG